MTTTITTTTPFQGPHTPVGARQLAGPSLSAVPPAFAPAGEALAPSFDHGVGDPVENDICVLPSHRVVLSEGNYLLLGALCRCAQTALHAELRTARLQGGLPLN